MSNSIFDFSRLVVERTGVKMKPVPLHKKTTSKSLLKRKFELEKKEKKIPKITPKQYNLLMWWG